MGTVPEHLADTVNRKLGRDVAGIAPTDRNVTVGTERDLADRSKYELVVVADADGMALAQNFRAGEEALRIMGRLGNMVKRGTGHRMMIQTSIAHSDLIKAMTSGNPLPYLEGELAQRAHDRLPPASEMMAVELRGELDPVEIGFALHATGATDVLGPAGNAPTYRWLLQGNMGGARVKLRPLVQHWRDRSITVRVDADPIDL
jgi:primosomal protein N'